MLTIAIGSDHRGYEYKNIIQQQVTLPDKKINWIDVGYFNDTRSDYPPIACAVAKKVQEGSADYGILLCGTGVGVSIVANRCTKIYAALVWNEETARRAKEEDNANIVCLPADYITESQAVEMVQAWLQAEFLDDRYGKRLEMIDR